MPHIDYESEIMTAVVDGLDFFGAEIRAGATWAKPVYREKEGLHSVAYEIVHYGIPYIPKDWMDRTLTETERQGFSRGVRHLERLGLIVGFSRRSRVSHLQPTPRGLEIGIELFRRAGDQADLEALDIALAAATWAGPEHRAALRLEVQA